MTSEYPPNNPGGAGVSSKLIVKGLQDQGIDVDVFALIGENQGCSKVSSGTWEIPNGNIYPVPKAVGENVSSYFHLPNLEIYDIVHVYNVRHLPACVVRSPVPVVSTMNNHLWICIDPVQHLYEGLPECTLKRNIKYAQTEGYTGLQAIVRTGIEYAGKSISRLADAFTVQTDGMKQVMEQCGYNTEKISTIGNILDTRFKVKGEAKKKIIFVGRLREAKAPDMVIKAYDDLPDHLKENWDLEIYGNGPMKEELEALIKEKKLHNVDLKYSPYQKLPEVYAKAALLIHPSQYTEPFSRTWLEATASGTPIVCSDNPSSRDILDGVAQFYDPFNKDTLVETLETVLSDPDLRNEMKQSGREITDRYQPEVIAKKYIDIYKNLCN